MSDDEVRAFIVLVLAALDEYDEEMGFHGGGYFDGDQRVRDACFAWLHAHPVQGQFTPVPTVSQE